MVLAVLLHYIINGSMPVQQLDGKMSECKKSQCSDCPIIDGCPMIGFVSPGPIREAMRRLLCTDTYEECIWLRINVDNPLPRELILARMERELSELRYSLCA